MSGFSAHAVQNDLLKFVNGNAVQPKEIHLIHGESYNKNQLVKELTKVGSKVLI